MKRSILLMKPSILLVFAAALALFAPTGCKALEKAKKAYSETKNKNKGDPFQSLSPQERKDRNLARKLQPYIKISNAITARVYDSRRRYLSSFKDAKLGPTCKERYIYAPYTLYSVERNAKAVEKVQGIEPRLADLEDGAKKYIAALRLLEPLLKKAKRYYDQKDWKEDKCKGAQQMHPKLMRAFAQFEVGAAQMDKAIKKYNLALHYRLLERVAKKHGKSSPQYFHKKIPLDARELLDLLRYQSREKKPDIDKIMAAVKKFDTVAVAMSDKVKGKVPTGWSGFKSAANDYVKACKELMRRLKSGKKFSRFERRRLAGSAAWMVDGSYAKVLKKFNDLIDRTNGVHFR